MNRGRRRLFRLRLGLALILMAAAMAAHAQPSFRTITDNPSTKGRAPYMGDADRSDVAGTTPSRDGSAGAKLAVQVDTAVIIPGQRDFLEPNIPNPFGLRNRSTILAFTIAEQSRVDLRVYDFFYNEVAVLVDGENMTAGRHTVLFVPPPTMPSGMYFYELKTGRTRELRRMMYMK